MRYAVRFIVDATALIVVATLAAPHGYVATAAAVLAGGCYSCWVFADGMRTAK